MQKILESSKKTYMAEYILLDWTLWIYKRKTLLLTPTYILWKLEKSYSTNHLWITWISAYFLILLEAFLGTSQKSMIELFAKIENDFSCLAGFWTCLFLLEQHKNMRQVTDNTIIKIYRNFLYVYNLLVILFQEMLHLELKKIHLALQRNRLAQVCLLAIKRTSSHKFPMKTLLIIKVSFLLQLQVCNFNTITIKDGGWIPPCSLFFLISLQWRILLSWNFLTFNIFLFNNFLRRKDFQVSSLHCCSDNWDPNMGYHVLLKKSLINVNSKT